MSEGGAWQESILSQWGGGYGGCVCSLPVSVEEGLAQALRAGLMEPLEAGPALQHFQVPPQGEGSTYGPSHSLLEVTGVPLTLVGPPTTPIP